MRRAAAFCLMLAGLALSLCSQALPGQLPSGADFATAAAAASVRPMAGSLIGPGFTDFPWPAGVRWQPVLHGTRWQSCPLDAVLFSSPDAPKVLARRLSLALPARPALLLEPDTLRLHWYEAGRHWVLSLAATAEGGSAGSLSVLNLTACGGRSGANVPVAAGGRQSDERQHRAVSAAAQGDKTNGGSGANQANGINEAPAESGANGTEVTVLAIEDALEGRQVRQRVFLHADAPEAVRQRWAQRLENAGWQPLPGAAGFGGQAPLDWYREGQRLQLAVLPWAQGTAVWMLDEGRGP